MKRRAAELGSPRRHVVSFRKEGFKDTLARYAGCSPSQSRFLGIACALQIEERPCPNRRLVWVGHHVHCHGCGKDYDVVLTWSDLHAISVADPEPLFRDFGNLVSVTLERVLVVQDVA